MNTSNQPSSGLSVAASGVLALAVILAIGSGILSGNPKESAFFVEADKDAAAQLRAEELRHQRQLCVDLHGENVGTVLIADGSITCTDKHGRKHKTQVAGQ